MIILENNAIFIADVHYNSNRTEIFSLLSDIKNKNIITNQLFLMGDIFDFLSQEINYFRKINKKLINLINQLSNNIQIIYIEGNHDFNLKTIFPNILIIPREKQPLDIKQNSKIVSIAHGDIYTPILYNIYTKIIRNHYLLSFINIIDINNFITKRVEEKLKNKHICHKQNNLNSFVEKRVSQYKKDIVIEGHFHQGLIK
ncbi:MAG: metallophosphoesterase, partial [Campylobacterota bacterium]|nr:metallophosphoesterase [Campylobacterota bacterium]